MIYLICTLAMIFYMVSPYFLTTITRKFKVEAILSDVVICYLIGMIIGNTKGNFLSEEQNIAFYEFTQIVVTACVLLALPILIIATKISDIVKNIRPIFLSFFLIVGCIVIATVASAWFYRNDLRDGAEAAGMMAAVYIGGTPNMISTAKAFNVTDTLFPIMQATDLFCSGLYVIFLTSIAKKLYGLFLPPYIPYELKEGEKDEHTIMLRKLSEVSIKERAIEFLKSAGIAIIIVAISIIIATIFPDEFGNMNQILLMTVLTTLAVIVCWIFGNMTSQWITITSSANYILLIFAVAAGSMADFGIIIEKGGHYIGFNALIFIIALTLHFILGFIFRIRVDILIISSVASIFGPGFIPQISYALGHTRLLSAGVAAGILGFIIANYIGFAVMEYCKIWFIQ